MNAPSFRDSSWNKKSFAGLNPGCLLTLLNLPCRRAPDSIFFFSLCSEWVVPTLVRLQLYTRPGVWSLESPLVGPLIYLRPRSLNGSEIPVVSDSGEPIPVRSSVIVFRTPLPAMWLLAVVKERVSQCGRMAPVRFGFTKILFRCTLAFRFRRRTGAR